MLDTGFFEYGLILIIALLVLGPEQFTSLAKKVGKFVGKFKIFISNINEEFEVETKIEKFKRDIDIPEIKEEAQEIKKLSSGEL